MDDTLCLSVSLSLFVSLWSPGPTQSHNGDTERGEKTLCMSVCLSPSLSGIKVRGEVTIMTLREARKLSLYLSASVCLSLSLSPSLCLSV